MFDPALKPVGLYVEEGRELVQPIQGPATAIFRRGRRRWGSPPSMCSLVEPHAGSGPWPRCSRPWPCRLAAGRAGGRRHSSRSGRTRTGTRCRWRRGDERGRSGPLRFSPHRGPSEPSGLVRDRVARRRPHKEYFRPRRGTAEHVWSTYYEGDRWTVLRVRGVSEVRILPLRHSHHITY